MNGQTHGQTDRQMDRLTRHRYTDRQDRHKDRQIRWTKQRQTDI